jgi:hypothetical protein
VSIDDGDETDVRVIFVTLVFLVAIIIAWFLYDSIFLRYIMLFMGVGSSTYAIWDVLMDGMISKKEDKRDGSDCAAMARYYNQLKPVSRIPQIARLEPERADSSSLDRGQRDVCHPRSPGWSG